jgi:3-oxoadipate enol-lactonase
MRRFAKFVVSQGLKQLGKQRADWLVGFIASQDRKLMVSVWMAAMAFDSRRRLAEIKCPTLVVAASRDEAVPLHHAKMLHDGITGSKLVIIDGADHALIWGARRRARAGDRRIPRGLIAHGLVSTALG